MTLSALPKKVFRILTAEDSNVCLRAFNFVFSCNSKTDILCFTVIFKVLLYHLKITSNKNSLIPCPPFVFRTASAPRLPSLSLPRVHSPPRFRSSKPQREPLLRIANSQEQQWANLWRSEQASSSLVNCFAIILLRSLLRSF